MYREPSLREPAPDAPPGGGPHPPVGASAWLAVVIWFLLAGVALLIGAASVSAFAGLTQGLDDPTKLNDLPIQQRVGDLRPDRQDRARPRRADPARRRDVRRDPADRHRRPDRRRGQDVLGQHRLRPARIVSAGIDGLRGRSRGASTITQQLVRQRLLNEDLVQDPNRRLERKLKEIIQSIRLTQAFPGEAGKQTIITAYLNQNYYGNQTYGVKAAARGYFGIGAQGPDARRGGDPRRAPQVAVELRPGPNAVERCSVAGRRRQTARRVDARRPDRHRHRPAPEHVLDLLAEGDRTPHLRRHSTPQQTSRAPRTRPGRPRPAADAPVDRAALRLGRPGGARRPSSAATTPRPATRSRQGGLRVTTTLDVDLQKIAEKWVKAAAFVPHTPRPGRRSREGARR